MHRIEKARHTTAFTIHRHHNSHRTELSYIRLASKMCKSIELAGASENNKARQSTHGFISNQAVFRVPLLTRTAASSTCDNRALMELCTRPSQSAWATHTCDVSRFVHRSLPMHENNAASRAHLLRWAQRYLVSLARQSADRFCIGFFCWLRLIVFNWICKRSEVKYKANSIHKK